MEKILLCILDGFGYCDSEYGNATLEASYIRDLMFSPKHISLLEASGRSVGLPVGQFGNSEVGHLTIGSGRVTKQKLPLISDSIESGELDSDKRLIDLFNTTKPSTCHVMGLFSHGGGHSDIGHFFWALDFLRKRNIQIKAHLFLDGRDVGFQDALNTLSVAIDSGKLRLSEISTIQGRFFAMDRDKRWDRTQIAYDLIVKGNSEYRTNDPISMIKQFYENGTNDETMPPIIVNDYAGLQSPDDLFWMLNFRTDRIKQLLTKFLDNSLKVINMVDCGENIDSRTLLTLFPSVEIQHTLGEVLSKNGIKQLRIAETEKYAHVTYFFNGGKEIQYYNEDRILVDSPKVKDYSETPDMSSKLITEKVLEALRSKSHQVIIVNFANADMVGHTGDFEATKESIRSLDSHIRELVNIAMENDYIVIITADHGNAEIMINKDDGSPKKTHTCSKVPFITVPHIPVIENMEGSLADIAPTVLKILGIEKPKEMTGKSLV